MSFLVREIVHYQAPEGKVPFRIWLDSLGDEKTKSRILGRLHRVEDGNLGDYRLIGDGVYELRMHYGPGYRIYFGFDRSFIVLLTGGDKNSQTQDIWQAKKNWFEFLKRR